MSAELAHGVIMPSTRTNSKIMSTVVEAEDLKPLPLPTHAILHSNSSPEARPVECHDPILEEDEDTGSEALEPVTPTSDSHPHPFHHQQGNGNHQPSAPHSHTKPLIVSTAPTPPSTPKSASKPASQLPPNPPSTTAQAKPTLARAPSKIKSLFRRTNSHATEEPRSEVPAPPNLDIRPVSSQSANLIGNQRRWSMSRSAGGSPKSSVSSTPPTPGSPTTTVNQTADQHPNLYLSSDAFAKKPVSRASTGLSLREKTKIVFGTTPKPERPPPKRRSNSVTDVNRRNQNQPDISIPAQAGSGLKARRLSTSLPDDFYVDVCELHDEFTSASKVPGLKKQCGTGATATVKVMNRKGDSNGSQYAVKEFRKRSLKEDECEYEKKVKSEFTIAQSLHHKNIVQTARLCTHSGRWNHVMEYCQHGDVFALIEQRYLKHEDHLCFFKQLLQGVAYLHEHGIAHRDIKLENLLMNNEGHIKITDFGVSEVFSGLHPGVREGAGQCGKEMNETRRCAPGICGSLPYIAPEVLAKNGDYDPRPLDVWSCAIVCLSMWHSGTPWPAAERKHSQYEKFAAGWDKHFAENRDGLVTEEAMPKVGPIISTLPSSGMRRLLLQMLHPDPEKRISIQQAVNDRWFKTIDCCSVDDETLKNSVRGIDAAGKKGCKVAAKMVVKKCHHHLPPEKRRLPQHRFDMGNGWSRYD